MQNVGWVERRARSCARRDTHQLRAARIDDGYRAPPLLRRVDGPRVHAPPILRLLMLAQELCEHHGVIDLRIFGPVEKRHLLFSDLAEHVRNRGIILQLVAISTFELSKSIRAMVEPLPERWRRRNVLCPKIERGRVFAHSSWPQAVHQDAHAILVRRRVIDALDCDHRDPGSASHH